MLGQRAVHRLGLARTLGGRLEFAHVPRDDDRVLVLGACIGTRHDRDGERQQLPVAMDCLHVGKALALLDGVEHAVCAGAVEQLLDGAAEDLVVGPAEQGLGPRAPIRDRTAAVDADDRLPDRVARACELPGGEVARAQGVGQPGAGDARTAPTTSQTGTASTASSVSSAT